MKLLTKEIKKGLEQCTDAQVLIFKRMYSHNNLDASINEAVDAMDVDRLDLAMDQITRTLQENKIT